MKNDQEKLTFLDEDILNETKREPLEEDTLTFLDEGVESFSQDVIDKDKMNIVEALSRAGVSGAALGLAPFVGGAGEAGKVLEDFASPSGEPATYKGMPMGKPKSKEEIRKFKDYSDLLSQLKEAYYKGRDETIEKEKEAIEDYPVLGTGALIAGSIPTTISTGGLAGGGRAAQLASKVLPKAESLTGLSTAAKAGKMAKEGLKAGALTGFGSGESKLLEGDVLGTAEETFESGIGGGLLGSLFPVAGKAISGTAGLTKAGIKSLPGAKAITTGFQAGEKGINITDEAQIAKFIDTSTKDIKSKISTLFGEEKASELAKKLDDQGLRVSIKNIVDDTKAQLEKGGLSKSEVSQRQEFLDDLLAVDSQFDKIKYDAFRKVEKQQAAKINKLSRQGTEVKTRTEFDTPYEELSPLPDTKGRVIGVEDRVKLPSGKEKEIISQVSSQEGQVPLRKLDYSNLKISEAEDLRRGVYKFTDPSNYEKPVGDIAKGMRSKISKAIDEAVNSSEFSEKRANMSNIFNALDSLGIKKEKFMSRNPVDQNEVTEKLIQAATADISSPKGRAFTRAAEFLNIVDGDISQQIRNKSDFLNRLSQLSRQSDAEGSTSKITALFGAAQKGAAKAGNIAGFASKGISDEASTAKKALISVLKEATPESLEALGVRLYNNYQQSAAPFVNQLQKAMSLPETRRTAVLYGIYQQPAFRKMLRNVGQEIVGGELQASELPMQGEQNEDNNDVTMSDNVSEVDSKKKVENSREPQNIVKSSEILEREGDGDATGAAKTGKYGITQPAIDQLKKQGVSIPEEMDTLEEINNLPKKERSDQYEKLASLYLDYINKKIPDSMKDTSNEFKENIIDAAFNLGTGVFNYKKLNELVKEANKLEGSEKNIKLAEALQKGLFDTANSEGKTLRGLAKRRAEMYNKFATSVGLPNISSVEQKENGELVYYGEDGSEVFKYKRPKHEKSDIGKLDV